MPWIHDVVERHSVFMNPMRPEKFLGLARQLGLDPDDRVLEVGAGRCGPASFLAQEFGCRVTAVEPHEPFLEDGRTRVRAAGLTDLVEFVHSDGRSFEIEPARYAAAFCLGATFAYDGLDGTLDALAPGVRPGGHVVAGEPYHHSRDDEIDYAMHPWLFHEIFERFEMFGLPVAGFVRSSTDEWDEYTSVHLRDLLDWKQEHPDDAEEIDGWRAEQLADVAKGYIGWAIVAGRKPLH
jgi:cyclopropane fatty-acyl-phospholipid synthase-like methyltransferase